MVGPLLGPIPHEGRLKFLVPTPLINNIRESALRGGLSISPTAIVRAYKARPAPDEVSPDELDWGHLYWLLIESPSHDYVKHFRGRARRGAYRIPRLLAKTCSKCGTPLFAGFCAECGERMPAKYVEVWRDKFAAIKTLGPFNNVERDSLHVKFVGEAGEYRIPRLILHEVLLSAKYFKSKFYINILAFEEERRREGV